MRRSRDRDQGFTVLEALIGLMFSALLAVVVLQLLGNDAALTRRVIAVNEDMAAISRARRTFLDEAARASGPASARQVGKLVIAANRLLVVEGGQQRPLYEWSKGQASFSFTKDGRAWRSSTDAAEQDIKRFVWTDGGREIVWWQP